MYSVNIEQKRKTSIKGHNCHKFEKLAGNNPNIDVVNVNVYINIWCNYPHAFLKKARRYCNRLRLSVQLSVMLSPPKPLDEIQPNLVRKLLT